MTTPADLPVTGFKFVAADLTSYGRKFSYVDALRTGEPVVAHNIDEANRRPCPSREGDGLCIAHTVAAACSGGQSAATAVGLTVTYDPADVLAEADGKIRVRALTVTGVFDPMHLIRLGLCPDLYGANLRWADLYGANLYGADLRRADLYGANLYGADLSGANLSGANLSGANLHGANLHGANLHGAYLDGADPRGADLPDGFRVPEGAIR